MFITFMFSLNLKKNILFNLLWRDIDIGLPNFYKYSIWWFIFFVFYDELLTKQKKNNCFQNTFMLNSVKEIDMS